MSKMAKQLIIGLCVILAGLVGYIGVLTFQNKNLADTKKRLDHQLEEFKTRETGQIIKNKDLQKQLTAVEEQKKALQEKVEKFANVDVSSLNDQIEKLKQEKDELTKKVETFKSERKDLLAKIDKVSEPKVVYKYVDAQGNEVDKGTAAMAADKSTETTDTAKNDMFQGLNDNDEVYWAQVLKEKTALELQVEKLRDDLTKAQVKITELKKTNSDLQLEMAKLTNEKEDIERQIKYGKDLSDSLSLELARAQNDKKFLNDRLSKINDENSGLRGQIKQLTSTKIALEKSIVRLQDEKKDIQHKLAETENVVQGRIDEIWKIKKSLDNSFGPEKKVNNEVELPPIVVSSKDMAGDKDPNTEDAPGINGNIVSVNNENNFVIIDIGQDKGISLGDSLNVYRGAEYVAGLQVIQVRQDIAAADIVSKMTDIKVGDAVR